MRSPKVIERFGQVRLRGLFVYAAMVAWGASPLVHAEEEDGEVSAPASLAAWLPENVIGYVHVHQLEQRLSTLLASDVWKDLHAVEPLQKALSMGPGRKLQKLLQTVRKATGREPEELLGRLAGREVAVGIRLGFSGVEVVGLTRGEGADDLEEVIGIIRRGIEREKGGKLESFRTTYRDWTIESIDQVSMVLLEDVLAVSNSRPYLENVIDLALGKSKSSARASKAFRRAVPEDTAKQPFVQLHVRPEFIPNYNIPKQVDEAFGSLLLQGWLGSIDGSELLSFSLDVVDGKLDLTARSFLSDGVKERYRCFFPRGPGSRLAAQLRKDDLLGVITLRRSFADWWEQRADLLEPDAVGKLSDFSQVMNVVFAGKSFEHEILPQVGPNVLVVSAKQTHPDLNEAPSPNLPGFAAVLELRDVDDVSDSMAGAFQTLVNLVNMDRVQKAGGDGIAMLLKSKEVEGIELYTVKFNNRVKKEKPDLIFNFSPSFAVVGKYTIVSSSRELAEYVISKAKEAGAKALGGDAPSSLKTARSTDRIDLSGQQISELLKANQEFLVAQQMIKKGQTQEEAEAELGTVFGLLSKLTRVRLRSVLDGSVFRLQLHVDTVY